MNHLEKSFTGRNSFWRYFIMIVAVFIASNTIGSIPLIISIIQHPEAAASLAANPNDLTPLGLNQNVALIYMIIPFIAALITFILLIQPLNQRKLNEVINGTTTFRWKKLFISSLIWIIISGIYLLISIRLDPENFSLNNTSGTLIPLIIISVLLIPLQAAFEEIIFRGYLMQGFLHISRNRIFPLLATALLFGLLHGLNPEVKEYGFLNMMPQYVLFGIIFGVITILDDGIEAAIGAHAANNAFLCVMVTNKAAALQTPAVYVQHNVYPWSDFFTMLVMGVIVIFVMRLIFKWGSLSIIFKKV